MRFCSNPSLSRLGENILRKDNFTNLAKLRKPRALNLAKFPAIRYNIFCCNLAFYTSRLTAYIKSFMTTFLLTQILIPSRDTTYWCAGFQLPADIQSATKHMIRVRKGQHRGWLLQIAVLVLKCSIQITFL